MQHIYMLCIIVICDGVVTDHDLCCLEHKCSSVDQRFWELDIFPQTYFNDVN